MTTNLLAEQKIAKLTLVEELRADLPNMKQRHDRDVQLLQELAVPKTIINALEECVASRALASYSSRDASSNLCLKPTLQEPIAG
jgi:hypothetical protein